MAEERIQRNVRMSREADGQLRQEAARRGLSVNKTLELAVRVLATWDGPSGPVPAPSTSPAMAQPPRLAPAVRAREHVEPNLKRSGR